MTILAQRSVDTTSIVPSSINATLENVTFTLMFAQYTTLLSYILVFEVHVDDMVGGLSYKYLPRAVINLNV